MGRKLNSPINETLDRVILDSSESVFRFAKKRIRQKRSVIVFAILASATGFVFYSLFVKANIFNFYPTSCLGSWENPQNAAGPPSLKPDSATDLFGKENSAFYAAEGTQIFCGGFKTENSRNDEIFKKATLRFSWAFAAPPSPTPVLEQTQFENGILDLPASSSVIVIPDNAASASSSAKSPSPVNSATPTPTPTPPLPTPTFKLTPIPTLKPTEMPTETPSEIFTPSPIATITPPTSTPISLNKYFLTLAVLANDTASNSQSPAPTLSPTATAGQLETITPEPSSGKVAGEETASPSLSPAVQTPVPTESVRPSALPEEATPLISSTPASASVLPSPTATPIVTDKSLDDFLEIDFSTDGKNWQPLALVNEVNFKALAADIPIASWEELDRLQISVRVLGTSDVTRHIYLDGMWVEASYEPVVKPGITENKNTAGNDTGKESADQLIKQRTGNINLTTVDDIENKYVAEGKTVTVLGDLNNDGITDFAASGTNTDIGQDVSIYSGANGSILKSYHLEGPYPGLISTLGDTNNDGVADYAILDPGYSTHDDGAIANEKGRITAYSGKDNVILWTYTGTAPYQFQSGNGRLLLAGDYDGDGKKDLLVGAPGLGDYGTILVLSSATGKEIKRFIGTQESGQIGDSFDVGPDLDNDGFPEIAVGEKYYQSGDILNAGRVLVLSGKDFRVIFKIAGANQPNGFFGVLAAFTSDFNNDGIPDLMADSHEYPNQQNTGGTIYIISSTDGTTIKKISGGEAYQNYQNLFMLR